MLLLEITENEWKEGRNAEDDAVCCRCCCCGGFCSRVGETDGVIIENADAAGTTTITIIITPIRHCDCDGDEKDAIIIAPRRALTIAKWRDTLGDMWWRQRRRR